MAVDVVVPNLGESISEGEVVSWLKADGDYVERDEPIVEFETDKTTIELPAPTSGTLRIIAGVGDTIEIGGKLATIDEAGEQPTPSAAMAAPVVEAVAAAAAQPAAATAPIAAPVTPSKAAAPAAPPAAASSARKGNAGRSLSPAVRRLVEENDLDASAIEGTGPGGRVTKADVLRYVDALAAQPEPVVAAPAAPVAPAATRPSSPAASRAAASDDASDDAPGDASDDAPGDVPDEERVRMTRMRRTIAERLVDAQHTAAILTTFNEVDMGPVMDLRKAHKERFKETYGVSLGFMSFFARAAILAAQEVRAVNARIEGDEIVYSNHVHLGIAASTDRGLVVPVVRNADQLSMAGIEKEIGRLATRARDNKLDLSDLSGGTFTISNGGVFGSLLSTPILNAPQSGILGMHKIEKRAVVVDDQIVIRPMMYLALSYDHRLIDGREAVTFLVRIKERLEDPSRMLLEI
jgi:2-oxoglutarate dehydrogenase E2 component (dihydrolipoamide succinyltransferase)